MEKVSLFFEKKILEILQIEEVKKFFLNPVSIEFYPMNRRNKKALSEKNVRLLAGVTRVVILIDEGEGWDYVVKIPFTGMIDHSKKECRSYQEAIKYGVDKFFAKTFKYRECNTLIPQPIYLMRRVDADESLFYSEGDPDYDTEYEIAMNCFSTHYSKEETDKLERFLKDEAINDIHASNVGWKKNWRPVLIDYAGYNYDDDLYEEEVFYD